MTIRDFITTMTRLLVGRSLGLLFVAAGLGVAGGLAQAASIALVQGAVGGGQPPAPAVFWQYVALVSFLTIAHVSAETITVYHCQRSMSDLVSKLIARVVATPLRRIEAIGQSRILTVLTQDVQGINAAVQAVPNLMLYGAILLGCIGQLARLNVIGAAACFGIIVVAIATSLFLIQQSAGIRRRARADIDRLMELFRGHAVGIKELQLNASRRTDFLHELADTAASYNRQQVRVTVAGSSVSVVFSLQFMIAIGVLMFILPGRFGVPMTTVSAYTLVLLYMMGPLYVLGVHLQAFGRGATALENIHTLGLSLEPAADILEPSRSPALPGWTEINLVGVTHTYPSGGGEAPFVLGPLNLSLRRGELVFITGGNGSGKTTLAKLLCGLYVPDTGVIALDGESLQNGHGAAHRQQCSAIFTDFHVFRQMFGLHEVGADAVAEQLRECRLSHKVSVKDGRFTTVDLSQGQRKRLALLVSLLEDREVCVFDEWPAEQDNHFREYFYEGILRRLRDLGKTVLVVTHDERYTHVADRVLKLEYGQLMSDVRSRVADPSIESACAEEMT